MSARLRPEGLAFLGQAPYTYVVSATVAAPTDRAFAALAADPGTWRAWYPGLVGGGYEGDGPVGPGTRRWVRLAGSTFRETVLAIEGPAAPGEGGALAYRVDESTLPLARALVEEWAVVPDPARGTSVVRWTFAADPAPLLALSLPAAPVAMGALFRRGMARLSAALA